MSGLSSKPNDRDRPVSDTKQFEEQYVMPQAICERHYWLPNDHNANSIRGLVYARAADPKIKCISLLNRTYLSTVQPPRDTLTSCYLGDGTRPKGGEAETWFPGG